MMILKLVECSDYKIEYGLLVVKNKNVTVHDIQQKIYEFKNSYKAYGYDNLKEMREDGFKTVEELFAKGNNYSWDIDRLVDKAFPKSWKVTFESFNGTVEC